METVEIELSENSYKIDIGYQFLSKETFSGLLENKEVLLVYDKNISGPALSHTESILKPLSNEFLTIGLEATEENKALPNSKIKINQISSSQVESTGN